MIHSKIFKSQLFILFLFTLTCSFVYIYGEEMPDHFLEISSLDKNSSFFSYYVGSFLQFLYYYSGFWVVPAFVLQTVVSATLFQKRGDIFDGFFIAFNSLFFVSVSYFLFPNFLGGGLYLFLDQNFGWPGVLSLFSVSFVLSGMIIFRNLFLHYLKTFAQQFYHYSMILFQKILARSEYYLTGLLNKILIKFQTMRSRKQASKLGLSGSDSRDTSLVNHELTNSHADPNAERVSLENQRNIKNLDSTSLPNTHEELLECNRESSLSIYPNDQDFDNLGHDEQFIKIANVDSPRLSSSMNTEIVSAGENESHSRNVMIDQKKMIDEQHYFRLVCALTDKKSLHKVIHPDDQYFENILVTIENKLNDLSIEGRIIHILKGPVVDTFELQLGPTMKVSKILSVSEDLSLALKGAPVRIVFPMKGRTTVGIEVPRHPREMIYLDEMITSKEFIESHFALPLTMGKDAFGEPVVVDLAAAPHMLVAGSTGAGKSVFINSILVSLLIKKSPKQMKLILIDPKQLELALYAKLPHLCMPVITDSKTASISLLWACEEMERRYSILTEFGVRNIYGFNEKLKKVEPVQREKIRKFYEYAQDEVFELPYIVIIVDEFADLMLSSQGKEIEKNICRLAAKARAAGIHLIVATQRPSVDVITGVIKSNFPVRVSFRVTSQMDSRTILNEMGAEKLLGKGDMLYKHNVETSRVHAPYVDEDEIEALASKLADIPTTFDPFAMEFIENGGDLSDSSVVSFSKEREAELRGEKDEKYNEAVRVVIEHRQASASLLQRRLGVGYNRAANLIDEMESNGVIGPQQGSKPRKVLLQSDEINS